ncbi:transposase domain-containing protein [Streptomyces sp. NPDC058637]|uniref:transposase domain-containing protein n=1 Tax=Streptomyces sp. NPDC058637 TaxID=3346569 RepID=UPI0036655351
MGLLTKVFTAELVATATAKHDRAERRRRLLSARPVVHFVLALCPSPGVMRLPTTYATSWQTGPSGMGH